jgi:hypothetical protein
MFKLISKSSNSKIGPISATMTVSKSCAPTCPLIEGGCYAKNSFVGMHWRKLDQQGGESLEALCQWIKNRASTIWRHNVAGDLPHSMGRIVAGALRAIVRANEGKRGFTYTHHTLTRENIALIEYANDCGFTVNVSTNNVTEADRVKERTSAPIVTLLPSDAPTRGNVTPGGRKVTVCPAEYMDKVSCSTCKLCAIPNRETIIGFRAHGTKKGAVNAISKGD